MLFEVKVFLCVYSSDAVDFEFMLASLLLHGRESEKKWEGITKQVRGSDAYESPEIFRVPTNTSNPPSGNRTPIQVVFVNGFRLSGSL